jgi:hypothetical protein
LASQTPTVRRSASRLDRVRAAAALKAAKGAAHANAVVKATLPAIRRVSQS